MTPNNLSVTIMAEWNEIFFILKKMGVTFDLSTLIGFFSFSSIKGYHKSQKKCKARDALSIKSLLISDRNLINVWWYYAP